MSRVCMLLVFTAWFLAASAVPGDTVTLQTDGAKLEGSLLMPASALPCPVVLLIAGSGPTDRDGNQPMMKTNALKLLAESLAGAGVASLRYDKRGIGRSAVEGLRESDLRFDYFVDDAAAWAGWLDGDDRFDKVVLLGHSEGALIASLAAGRAGADGVISLCGAGKPAGDVLREQLAQQSEAVLRFSLPILDSLENGRLYGEPDPALRALFRPEVQPYLISWMAYDPAQALAACTAPVLIVQGDRDLQVPVAHAHLLAKARPDAQLEIVAGMNHVLKSAPDHKTGNLATYFQPAIPLMDGLTDTIASFIRSLIEE